ncbi:hypothetical protein GOBAR_AA27600 [Gossypium barbadense]|uniref:Uncharacterized protein n=1 Tax=Gossypium barbadense TaxID=3634 RepID=A0A2P5WPQ8_GOSBA|nr:hypothetical protein GOBAR_AA27600 [Gossypium barbadense]
MCLFSVRSLVPLGSVEELLATYDSQRRELPAPLTVGNGFGGKVLKLGMAEQPCWQCLCCCYWRSQLERDFYTSGEYCRCSTKSNTHTLSLCLKSINYDKQQSYIAF